MSQRALDLLEKLAHEHADWIEAYKTIFIGPLAKSDKREIRLQIVRALPLFQGTPAQARRVDRSGVSVWTESPLLTSSVATALQNLQQARIILLRRSAEGSTRFETGANLVPKRNVVDRGSG